MSGNKIHPVFVILCAVGILIVGFALFGSMVAGAKADESDADKAEVSLQLSTMLNFAVAGGALILAGLGFQLTAGPKTASPAFAAPLPGQPYGQPAQPQYQQPPAPGQQWGQQPPAQP